MANVSAGVAYVDIKLGSVEKFKRDIKREVENAVGPDLAKPAGEKFTKEFGDSIKRNISSSRFGNNFRSIGRVFETYAIPAIAASLIAYSPLLGGLLGAALVGGGALAVVAAGIASVAKDPVVKAGFDNLRTTASNVFLQSARVFAPEVRKSLDLITREVIKLQPLFQSTFAAASKYVMPLTQGLTSLVRNALPGFNQLVAKAGPVVSALNVGLGKLGKALGQMFSELVKNDKAVEGMAQALTDAITIVSKVIVWTGKLISALSRLYANWRQGLTIWKNFTGQIASLASSMVNRVISFVSNLASRLRSLISSGVSNARSAFSSGISGIVSLAAGLPGRVVAALGSLYSRLYSAGANAMRGFLNGLSGVAGAVIARARGIANQVVSTIRNALSIHSPSRVMEELGRMTGLGFELGLQASMPAIAIPGRVKMDFGSPAEPQMDRGLGNNVIVNQEFNNVALDYHKMNEDLWFMMHARG